MGPKLACSLYPFSNKGIAALKKQRLFREEIKDRHTSHWDLDMLSREELEAAMGITSEIENTTEKSSPDSSAEE
jgi:hypothetical protein